MLCIIKIYHVRNMQIELYNCTNRSLSYRFICIILQLETLSIILSSLFHSHYPTYLKILMSVYSLINSSISL